MPTQSSSAEIELDDSIAEGRSVRRSSPQKRETETQTRDGKPEGSHHHSETAEVDFADLQRDVEKELSFEEGGLDEGSVQDGESSIWKPDDIQSGTWLSEELQVKEKLVDGGMSVIYLAEHARHGLVAVKIMRPKERSVRNPEKEAIEKRRFLREIAVLKKSDGTERFRLNHPDIIEVLECGAAGPDGQGLYLVTPYCEEGDLSTMAENFASASPERLFPLLKMLRAPVRALEALHRRRFVYLDLKPENVLLRKKESGGLEALLADFGLIQRIDSEEGARMRAEIKAREKAKASDASAPSQSSEVVSKASHVVGTAPYVSPEQVDDVPENIGPWCDVFSLGVMLYDLLSEGEGIFGAASFDEEGELDFDAHCDEMKAFKKGERDILHLQEARQKNGLEPLSQGLADDVMKLLSLDRKVRMSEGEIDVIYNKILRDYELFLQVRAMREEAEQAEDMAREIPKEPSPHSEHNEYEPGQRMRIMITRKTRAGKEASFEKISKEVIIREKLGEGGMSKVYRVEMDGQDFALKIIAFSDGDLQQQFRNLDLDETILQGFSEQDRAEAEAGNQKRRAELTKDRDVLVKRRRNQQRRERTILEMVSRPENAAHPHLMRIEAAGEIEGDHEERAFLLMPFCEQGDLTNKMKEVREMSERDEFAFFESLLHVVEAVEWLHDKKPHGNLERDQGGILDLDLKPENILFDSEGHPIVADFGLARRDLRDPSVMVGTPVYMPPEQFLENKPSNKSDIFSLGATLYYALSGGKTYLGEMPANRLQQAGVSLSYAMRRKNMIPLAQARKQYRPDSPLPDELVLLVQRCLSRDALYRPESLSEEYNHALAAWKESLDQRKRDELRARAKRPTSVGSRAA